MNERTERNCNKCIRHTSGMCDSWNCNMQTVEDVKKEAVNEYVKAVVEELSNADPQEMMSEEQRNVLNYAIEIVKQGGVYEAEQKLKEMEV